MNEIPLKPHLKSAVALDSSASTGISANPKVPSLINSPRAEEFPSQNSNCSADKWSFLSHSIEQINYLTTVVLGSNRLTWLKEFKKHHTLHIPPDTQKDVLASMLLAVRGLPLNVCIYDCFLLALSGKQRDAWIKLAANAVSGEFMRYSFSDHPNLLHLVQSSQHIDLHASVPLLVVGTRREYSVEYAVLEVCEAINEVAFKTSEYPVLLSIENHLKQNQQKKMVEIFLEVFKDKLLKELDLADTSDRDQHLQPLREEQTSQDLSEIVNYLEADKPPQNWDFALNFQTNCQEMLMNHAMFEKNGHCGYG
uniref:PI-PLC Y-box domain-containing protein n=1 Tax=Heterorhabditis bacteriophora TaxID=37862 RepID=A0A1I7X3B0_HETBA